MSTFHGLEMAKQALFTQQMGLYTTGHNISNVNTAGYSRQRVNFETLSPYPSASRNSPVMPGQIGQGVKAGTVQRIRDSFYDHQYRTQNSQTSYWQTRTDALGRMEGLMNEADGTDGFNKTLMDFFKSLEGLSTNPENIGARQAAIQQGVTVAGTFNHTANSLENVRKDLQTQIGKNDGTTGKLGDANSLLRQINALNKQIGEVEPHGYLPNDLYDQRDRLIDELSSIVKINVDYVSSGDSSLKIADGIAVIKLADEKGKDTGITLLEAEDRKLSDSELGQFKVEFADDSKQNAVSKINFVKQGTEKDIGITNIEGSLKGLVEAYGYLDGDDVLGDIPSTIAKLDKLAENFAKAFNKIHGSGIGFDGITTGLDFFTSGKDNTNGKITAGNMTVNKELRDHPEKLAVSTDKTAGNGDNAKALAGIIKKSLTGADVDSNEPPFGEGVSVLGYFQQIISKMAVDTQEARSNVANYGVLQQQIQNDRLSVSAVSLDEEMTNLLKFQHAYNASARSLTAMDELLDKIINSMGLVGR